VTAVHRPEKGLTAFLGEPKHAQSRDDRGRSTA
jgi:hypothetical protein